LHTFVRITPDGDGEYGALGVVRRLDAHHMLAGALHDERPDHLTCRTVGVVVDPGASGERNVRAIWRGQNKANRWEVLRSTGLPERAGRPTAPGDAANLALGLDKDEELSSNFEIEGGVSQPTGARAKFRTASACRCPAEYHSPAAAGSPTINTTMPAARNRGRRFEFILLRPAPRALRGQVAAARRRATSSIFSSGCTTATRTKFVPSTP
jgi:hypothetical protein